MGVSDRLLRRSSTRTRTGLEKAGKDGQKKSSACGKTEHIPTDQLGYLKTAMMDVKL